METPPAAAPSPRPRYRPSGRVAGRRFVPLCLLLLLAAVALADVYYRIMHAGWCVPILVPAFLALLLAGAVHLVVQAGHCRNTTVAPAVGLAAGAVLYLGHFMFLYYEAKRRGGEGWSEQASLLHLVEVAWRMQAGVGWLGNFPDWLAVGVRWLVMAIEAWIAVTITAIGGVDARRPYNETAQRWLNVEYVRMPTDAARRYVAWLLTGAALDGSSSPQGGDRRAVAILYYDDSATGEPIAYLSIRVAPSDQDAPRWLIKDARVAAGELMELMPLFPNRIAVPQVKT